MTGGIQIRIRIRVVPGSDRPRSAPSRSRQDYERPGCIITQSSLPACSIYTGSKRSTPGIEPFSCCPFPSITQGGKVYDSKYGVTCHWCRQKTLEDHVTCTNQGCGKGKRLATTFW